MKWNKFIRYYGFIAFMVFNLVHIYYGFLAGTKNLLFSGIVIFLIVFEIILAILCFIAFVRLLIDVKHYRDHLINIGILLLLFVYNFLFVYY